MSAASRNEIRRRFSGGNVSPWTKRAPQLAQWTFFHLVNRTDVWGGYLPLSRRDEGRKTVTKPATASRGKITLDAKILESHFCGRSEGDVIGLHAIGPQGTCRWIGWDIDNHGSADAAANRTYAVLLFDKLTSMGFTPLLTDSNGNGGFHVLVVFANPIASSAAFTFAKSLIANHGLPTVPETFPKQPDLVKLKFGNWLRLPGRHHTLDHWSKVWNGSEFVADDAAIDRILAIAGDDPQLVPQTALPQTQGDDRRTIRCKAYFDKLPSSVAGQRGHDRLLQAACECLRFGLSDGEAIDQLRDYNRRADPPWDETEIQRKLAEAHKKINGDFGQRLSEPMVSAAVAADLVFDPRDPLTIARAFLKQFYGHSDHPTLTGDGATFDAWNGVRYVECPNASIRSLIYPYLESAKRLVKAKDDEYLVPFQPTQTVVNQVVDALRAIAYTQLQSPCWLTDGDGMPAPTEIVPALNGLVHLRPDGQASLFRSPTPVFYSRNAIDFPYNPAAPEPTQWLDFLDQLWPEDRQSIELLQEWFGYCLTPDTRQQKALLIKGPKRAGKGTIARVLTRLLGVANVAGPTLSSLAGQFGLWGLIGKQLAIIDDARLGNRADQAVIVERILTITGEGSIDIDRKNLQPVTMRLTSRLMMLTNDLPKLSDASGAFVSRFLVLVLTRSFYGEEDTALESRLYAELPSILLWAIEGWKRLRQRGYFVQADTAADEIQEMNDLASPISAFTREWCLLRSTANVSRSDLYEAWRLWCLEQGRDHSGNQASFGRDLRSAVSSLSTEQRRDGNQIIRCYGGITLTEAAKATLAAYRLK